MKKLLTWMMGITLLFSLARTVAAEELVSVAVFDFDSKDDEVRDLGPKVASLLTADLSAEPQINLVERSELTKVLGEQELGLSGTVNSETAAKVGQLTGAKVLVTGRVFKADAQTILVAKIIGTETGRVYGEIAQGGPSATLADLAATLAKKIANDVVSKSDSLLAKVQTRAERIAKIKASLTSTNLPVVLVKIDERHYGPHIIDPAAATELSVILQQCGFTLADDNSSRRATLEITGDAFSAYGLQKGNLISCTARVELKVRDAATGNILLTDRQNSVGVDIAEQTAAKKALENAADELAQRIIPKLAK